MPRADPSRSDYCASRHLLRNLDDASELRRNPLVRDYFHTVVSGSPRRDIAERAALERIRDDVRASLARCGHFAGGRDHVALGRIHGALLRCDIDDQPAPAVAAELGLSERQLRRERRVAHGAFARAFRTRHPGSPVPATVCDVATLRLAEAVELHELGQNLLAQREFASIAANVPAPERRIEALCVAAEAEIDGLRHQAAAAHLADARAVMMRHARELDDDALCGAEEHVDFVAWMMRWQTAVSAGLGTQPPLAYAPRADDRARSERRRALFVRAAAEYAKHRMEVGDFALALGAVQRARDVQVTLHPARTKERLAVLMAEAQLYSLRAPRGAARDRYSDIEQRAAACGHVRVLLASRSERVVAGTVAGEQAVGRVFNDLLAPFGAIERRTMVRTFAWVARLVAECESNPRDAVISARLVEELVPPRGVNALGARCVRASVAIDARRFDVAREIAQSVYADAEHVGNGRLRGAAARNLAACALGSRRRAEAQRYIREALTLTERFGSQEALDRTNVLARRLDIA